MKKQNTTYAKDEYNLINIIDIYDEFKLKNNCSIFFFFCNRTNSNKDFYNIDIYF